MKLFVYGTLKKGYHNNYLLKNSEYMGKAITTGKMYNVGKFPAVTSGKDIIKGELYKIDQFTLNNIDYLEGYNKDNIIESLYIRKEISVIHNRKIIKAYGYIWNSSITGLTYISNGIFLNKKRKKVLK